jgi:hypothetical protein
MPNFIDFSDDCAARGLWVSASGHIGSRGRFRHLCLRQQNSVSRQQRPRQAETGSNAALLLRKTENLVLLGPFGGQVGEASNPHAMRQPPIDSGLDEVRCKESK